MDKLIQAHINLSVSMLEGLVNRLEYHELQELRNKLKEIDAMIAGKQYRLFKEREPAE